MISQIQHVYTSDDLSESRGGLIVHFTNKTLAQRPDEKSSDEEWTEGEIRQFKNH
jgi:hypothetical protein